MGCTMSFEADVVFPDLLLVLASFIFIIYVLSQLIRGSKKLFLKFLLFFVGELGITAILVVNFSVCPNGCETSCPSYPFRPFVKALIMLSPLLICSMTIYLIELKIQHFLKKSFEKETK